MYSLPVGAALTCPAASGHQTSINPLALDCISRALCADLLTFHVLHPISLDLRSEPLCGRLCKRGQGEAEVMRQTEYSLVDLSMRKQLVQAWPWKLLDDFEVLLTRTLPVTVCARAFSPHTPGLFNVSPTMLTVCTGWPSGTASRGNQVGLGWRRHGRRRLP